MELLPFIKWLVDEAARIPAGEFIFQNRGWIGPQQTEADSRELVKQYRGSWHTDVSLANRITLHEGDKYGTKREPISVEEQKKTERRSP